MGALNMKLPDGSLYSDNNEPIGIVEVVRRDNKVEVFVTAQNDGLSLANDIFKELSEDEAVEKWRLLEVFDDGLVNIYPFKNWEVKYFTSKYSILSKITLEGFRFASLQSPEEVDSLVGAFPKAFVKTYSYGLGLKKDYTGFVHQLEEMKIHHLVITNKGVTKIFPSENKCVIKLKEFEEIRRCIDRVSRHAQQVASIVKTYAAYNTLSFFLKDANFPMKEPLLEDDALSKLMAKALPVIASGIQRAEKREALDFVAKNAVQVLKEEPEELIKLKNDIELVTLEEFIKRFEEMLEKDLSETNWQKLLNDNPFVLNMAFGYPVIKIHGQASIGGRKISGDGDKITDFLVKNDTSNNVAIIEIKKPGSKLLKKQAYREGLFAPSSELAGAVNQMLDQKYHLQKSIANIKDNSRIRDIETYSVHGVLIVGRSLVDLDQQKSFELFRGNSKDISIVTFDELLVKLKMLHSFLISSSTS